MKNKILGLLAISILSSGVSNAVTLSTSLIANTANNVGLVTTLQSGSLTTVTGTAYIYTSSANLALGSLSSTIINTKAAFESLFAADPGLVRNNIAITNGAILSSGSTELGAVGNWVYVWMQSADLQSYGAYKGIQVPALGNVVINSGTLADLGVGTSVFSGTAGTSSGPNTASGFQLAYVPEPSAALLGALGALGLLRRRRI